MKISINERSIELLNIEISPNLGWGWISILSYESNEQGRSLFHFEINRGTIKIQLLWLANKCWCFNVP